MNRAQSDAIGFVLVFSLIVLTVGTVYAMGYPALQDLRTDEQLENMERAFDVLDDNVDDMARDGAPSRATEIKLNGGVLAVNESTEVSIEAVDASTGENFTLNATSTPITYSRDDTTVASTYGAVVRDDRGASVMRDGPGWVVGDDHAMIPLVIAQRVDDRTALGGSSTVLVRTDVVGRGVAADLHSDDVSDVNVTVTVTSPWAGAWGQYFESQGMEPIDANPDDGDVTYRITGVESVVVQQTAITVRLER
ncbi:DUF7289 family protein [Halobaculum marinum]|uniref:Archaeal Type IV pilin N-terminal domain-containing protein n=1 Tax=Halobaculum marinum TaxID=3031996 RepID=A0ABD5X213_9EURY|nr:hypothetical protein [Halobaculum sp. DT55]